MIRTAVSVTSSRTSEAASRNVWRPTHSSPISTLISDPCCSWPSPRRATPGVSSPRWTTRSATSSTSSSPPASSGPTRMTTRPYCIATSSPAMPRASCGPSERDRAPDAWPARGRRGLGGEPWAVRGSAQSGAAHSDRAGRAGERRPRRGRAGERRPRRGRAGERGRRITMSLRVLPSETLAEIVDELSTVTCPCPGVAPGGAGGERPPTLAEITAFELTVSLESAGTDITAWIYGAGTWAVGTEVLKNVNIENTGRGVYVEATGLLTVTLHAGDIPFLTSGAAVGAREWHAVLIVARYNSNVDECHKRIRFAVENLNKVPRVP